MMANSWSPIHSIKSHWEKNIWMLLHIYLITMVNLTWLQLHPGARKYCPGSGRAVGHFCMLYVSKKLSLCMAEANIPYHTCLKTAHIDYCPIELPPCQSCWRHSAPGRRGCSKTRWRLQPVSRYFQWDSTVEPAYKGNGLEIVSALRSMIPFQDSLNC